MLVRQNFTLIGIKRAMSYFLTMDCKVILQKTEVQACPKEGSHNGTRDPFSPSLLILFFIACWSIYRTLL